MSVSNRAWGRSIVEGLASRGASRFFLSPGARSAPLVAALQSSGLEVSVHFDERGMAFAALGWSAASGRPAVCLTTSGSAVANLLPACVEASYSNIPLIFMTADRPPELRGTGANQTIHQPEIFGEFVRDSADLPCPPSEGGLIEEILSRIMSAALGESPGPVHLNVPFREPLLEQVSENRAIAPSQPETTEISGFSLPTSFSWERFVSEPGVVVLGREKPADQSAAVLAVEFAHQLGWPVFADALSGGRLLVGVVRHVDGILESRSVPVPRRVLHFGGAIVSKRLAKWLSTVRQKDYLQVRKCPPRLDPWGQDPCLIRAGTDEFCRTMKAFRPVTAVSALAKWHKADAAVEALLAETLDITQEITEPAIARVVAKTAIESGRRIFLGNSMPVRDFDFSSAAVSPHPVTIFGNRGASGIDGNIATIAGISMVPGPRVLAVIGDLATLHDLNSLALMEGKNVDLVVVNNGGGGIFRFLPIALDERLIETPHEWDFESAARQFRIPYQHVCGRLELESLLGSDAQGPRLIECRTCRDSNYNLHSQITKACGALVFEWGK